MKRILPILALFAMLCSCNFISSLVKEDDEVVAKIGKHKLYRSELSQFIPSGLSPEDSAKFAGKYIKSWAADILYASVATEQLSDSEKNLVAEMEDYRKSLLRFRYEQRYVSDRLDTLISDDQIQKFYNDHQSMFVLERPIVKARYVDIMKNARNADNIIRMMSSDDYSDLVAVDSLASTEALRYLDLSEEWVDISALTKEFAMGADQLLSLLSGKYIKDDQKDRGDIRVAYICDIRKNGFAPIEYCTEHICNLILSERKHQLLMSLEQDLLDDALSRNKLVIY